MKFQNLTPMLWTKNLEETITFYTTILGFICSEYNKDWKWAALHKDEIEIMLAYPNEHMNQEIGFSGSFYFKVDEVESLWNDLKNKTTVVYDLETFEWGMKEFAIKDNNGYLLQFGQNIEI